MLTFITGLLGSFNWAKLIPWVLGAAGVLFGLFRHQQAKITTAEANQKVTEVTSEAAQANAEAEIRRAETQKNAALAKAETAKIPESDLDKEGEAMGIVRD